MVSSNDFDENKRNFDFELSSNDYQVKDNSRIVFTEITAETELSTRFGDFNRDGLTDMLLYIPSTQYLYLFYYDTQDSKMKLVYHKASFVQKDGNGNYLTRLTVVDFDGDGSQELLVFDTDAQKFRVQQFIRNVFKDIKVIAKNEIFPDGSKVFTVDFNGDNITDLATYASGFWNIYYGTGNGYTRVSETMRSKFLAHGDPQTDPEYEYFFYDMNGDGKTDFFYKNYSDANERVTRFKIFYSTGVDFISRETVKSSTSFNLKGNNTITDIDADGLPEFLYMDAEIGNDGYIYPVFFNKGKDRAKITSVFDSYANETKNRI